MGVVSKETIKWSAKDGAFVPHQIFEVGISFLDTLARNFTFLSKKNFGNEVREMSAVVQIKVFGLSIFKKAKKD